MDFPKRVVIHEEGPREGFQIEKGAIPTSDKIAFVEALAETGLKAVQAVSFVDARRVPGMADAEEVARGIRRRDGVKYDVVWLNLRGLERALASPLDAAGRLQVAASETFQIKNTNKTSAQSLDEQRRVIAFCLERRIPVESAIVMTAFGCNFEGAIAPQKVIDGVSSLIDLMDEHGLKLKRLRLADTVGWAAPDAVARLIGALREKWPDLPLGLHLHDTRGTGLANALVGLGMGVDHFDSSCAGLGGCPFAGHAGAAGNICTEDFVFMCHEMGIDTGIDLDALIECARMAETIVGHPLPGKVMKGGSLSRFRA
jgi:hydroxymethylglutaryl-CoA lyase